VLATCADLLPQVNKFYLLRIYFFFSTMNDETPQSRSRRWFLTDINGCKIQNKIKFCKRQTKIKTLLIYLSILNEGLWGHTLTRKNCGMGRYKKCQISRLKCSMHTLLSFQLSFHTSSLWMTVNPPHNNVNEWETFRTLNTLHRTPSVIWAWQPVLHQF